MHHNSAHGDPLDRLSSRLDDLELPQRKSFYDGEYESDLDEHEFDFLDVQSPEELIASLNRVYIPVERGAGLELDGEVHRQYAPAPPARGKGPGISTWVTIGVAVTLGWSALTNHVGDKPEVGKPKDASPEAVEERRQKPRTEGDKQKPNPQKPRTNDDPGLPPRPSLAEEKRLSRLAASENCESYAPDISKLPYGEPDSRPRVSPEGSVLHQTLVTFYLPKNMEDYESEAQAKLEGGPNDRRGKRLVTVEEHLRTGKRVSIAMDAKSSFSSIYGYGTEITVYYPGISKIYPQLKDDTFPAVLVDTGCAFSYTMGRKTDVAVKSDLLAKSKSGVGVWWVDGQRKPEKKRR